MVGGWRFNREQIHGDIPVDLFSGLLSCVMGNWLDSLLLGVDDQQDF